MRVLGVDPGLRITGYACLDGTGLRPRLIEAGVIRLRTLAGDAHDPARSVSRRLLELERDLDALIARLKPESVAVEALFAHVRHPATAIAMAHARGVMLLSIERAGLPLVEFKPNLVKKALTGNGLASKPQMQGAVQAWFGLAEPPSPPDVADAIAIALCATRRGTAGVASTGRRRRAARARVHQAGRTYGASRS